MANAIVKMKIMPSSPKANLNKIEKSVKEVLNKNNVGDIKLEKEPIAFGLNALNFLFFWPEEKELEELESKLKKIKDVNSAEVVEMRRAIG